MILFKKLYKIDLVIKSIVIYYFKNSNLTIFYNINFEKIRL